MTVEIFDYNDNLVRLFTDVIKVDSDIERCDVLYRDSEKYLILETIDLKEQACRAKTKGVYVRVGK